MKVLHRPILLLFLALLCTSLPEVTSAQEINPIWKFDFGGDASSPGYMRVAPASVYKDETGYGYEPGAQVALGDNGKPPPATSLSRSRSGCRRATTT